MGKNSSIPTPIFKIHVATNQTVQEFVRIKDVLVNDCMSYTRLKRLICMGTEFNGHIYKPLGDLPPGLLSSLSKASSKKDVYVPHWEGKQPWEGDDGFFDIAGWINAC